MSLSPRHKEELTRWFLEYVSDASEKWLVPVEPMPFIIGRDEDCHLTLPSKWISRQHAEIRSSAGSLWVRDMQSTNGTFVNHVQIQQSELLEPGDIISFGKSEFRVKSVESIRPALAEVTSALDSSEEVAQMASLEPLLRKLLRERSVIPHFQPNLRFSDLSIVGYEILGRIDEDGLPSDPGGLFDVATYLGCAPELSSIFREVGVDIGRRLPGSPLLFANTDPIEMEEVTSLAISLQTVRLLAPSNRIILEISENAVTDSEEMLQFKDSLADLNIGLAFDDFGVGQVRLAELAKAPPDFLKFDISLVRNIHLAPNRLHQMVLTFVKAAKDLGIATIAEGIECREESETCDQLGFEYGQGFLYGKPSPISDLETG